MKLQQLCMMAYLFCLSLAEITQLNMFSSEYPGSPVPSVNKAWDTRGPVNNMALSQMVQTQAIIWVSIFMVIIVLASACALYTIDDPKTRDSLLYAKFLTNMKDK